MPPICKKLEVCDAVSYFWCHKYSCRKLKALALLLFAMAVLSILGEMNVVG